ncbi:MAG: DUF2075 domain-containing protein [Candidatus Aenigmarchaeota archaeon]|nr:DUF2075 domain-containing protein [Candidatus Aenigmarchaeota archaeon]
MKRSYYSRPLSEFLTDDSQTILGNLTENHEFRLEEQQRNAWLQEIILLKEQLANFEKGHILFEYSIPRMGRRVDVILIVSGMVFVLEFKVGSSDYPKSAIDQVVDYAVDLKNFQEGSHNIKLVPILVATNAPEKHAELKVYEDGIFQPLYCNSSNLSKTIAEVLTKHKEREINPYDWENSVYMPTPTIIEAAQALYQGHSVEEISRSDSGKINLSRTAEAINQIIDKAKQEKIKAICFITGVPGAGKTLAGLNLANERHKFIEEEHAVFLSGNGPLVDVLQEALARNEVKTSQEKVTKTKALKKSKAFIQNIHHFRDDALSVKTPPLEKVVIFDEAQRAWTHKQTSAFMQKKKGVLNFDMSEPEFLISIMDRHKDWAVIICLIGGGQEINTGEAGLPEWFTALRKKFAHWQIYLSTEISEVEYTQGANLQELLGELIYHSIEDLHLSTDIRSFRSENVSKFIKSLLDCDKESAIDIVPQLEGKYPIVVTRDINKAKVWLKQKARGSERIGLVASSGAYRLKPYGLCVQVKINAKNWFLNPKEDVRSSFYLEDVATEFDIQGLELDWVCVAWDADLRFEDGGWAYKLFRGKGWQTMREKENQNYLKNTYRVLLTRARQGLVIFIPEGDLNDATRLPEFYDKTFKYLRELGIKEV